MDWNAVGAVGEIGGAIGVVLTLIYLAGQLRQNTRALRSSTYQAYNDMVFSYADSLLEHAATISRLQAEQGDMTPEMQTAWSGYLLKTFAAMESNYLHHRAGSLDDDVFEAKMKSSAAVLLANPIVRQAWDDSAVEAFGITAEFKAVMDQRLQSKSP